ncbi:hypothetical protein D3C85_1343260 [compost metagenome]
MNQPTKSSTTLARNGTRQPQDNISSSGSCATAAMASDDRIRPGATPTCGKLPNSPFLPSGACSTAIRTAPPHSPPTAMPCKKRMQTSNTAAQYPMLS